MLEDEIEDAAQEFPAYSITINFEESKDEVEESRDEGEEFKGRIKSNSVYAGSTSALNEGEELKNVEYGIGLVRNKSQSIKNTDWRKWYE